MRNGRIHCVTMEVSPGTDFLVVPSNLVQGHRQRKYRNSTASEVLVHTGRKAASVVVAGDRGFRDRNDPWVQHAYCTHRRRPSEAVATFVDVRTAIRRDEIFLRCSCFVSSDRIDRDRRRRRRHHRLNNHRCDWTTWVDNLEFAMIVLAWNLTRDVVHLLGGMDDSNFESESSIFRLSFDCLSN